MAVSHPSGNVWDRLTAEAQNEIMAGALAIRRIRQHEGYSHWVAVGKALLRLQEEAMRLSGSNSPQGRGYTALRAELGSRVPDLEELDKTSKSHAVWLAKNLAAVEKWRKTLWFNVRDTLNHPSVIKRRYESGFLALATRGFGIALGEGAKPLSPAAKKDAEIVRLQEDLDAKEAEIRRLKRGSDNVSEGRDWTWTDDPEAIAAIWLQLYPSKAPQIASKVLELNKSTARKVRRGALK
jgi:hypothetical protein